MAGFEVIIYGRFWVITEVSTKIETSLTKIRLSRLLL
jgi:hypothetical protein